MSGFKISRKTRKHQKNTMREIAEYKRRILRVVQANPTRQMNMTDIAREAANDHTNENEIQRITHYVRQMKVHGLIGISGGEQKGYWSEVKNVGRVEPTYKPTPVVEEADEKEEAPTEASAEDVRAEEEAVESPKVKVPVKRAPIFQDVIPVRKQPVQVNREPRKITITIEL